MKRISYVLVVLAGLGVMFAAALTVVAGANLFLQSDEDSFEQPTVVFDISPMPSMPVLTTEQEHQAIDIALADSRVRQLLGERSYNVAETIIWTGSESRLMGVVVQISLDEPSSLSGSWLQLSWSCDQEPLPPPERVPYNATFNGVTSIQIFVDINTEEIAQILPLSDGGVTLVGEREFTGTATSITSCYND